MIDFLALAFNIEVISQFGKKLVVGHAVEVLHHTVIIDNLQVAFGEADSQEEVVFLFAGMVRVGKRLFVTHKSSSCSAVMTVGNIQIRNAGKQLGDACNGGFVVNHPEVMAKTVLCHIVVFRFFLDGFVDDGLQTFVVGESKENRLEVGIIDANVLHAVLFLILASELVLFDDAF